MKPINKTEQKLQALFQVPTPDVWDKIKDVKLPAPAQEPVRIKRYFSMQTAEVAAAALIFIVGTVFMLYSLAPEDRPPNVTDTTTFVSQSQSTPASVMTTTESSVTTDERTGTVATTTTTSPPITTGRLPSAPTATAIKTDESVHYTTTPSVTVTTDGRPGTVTPTTTTPATAAITPNLSVDKDSANLSQAIIDCVNGLRTQNVERFNVKVIPHIPPRLSELTEFYVPNVKIEGFELSAVSILAAVIEYNYAPVIPAAFNKGCPYGASCHGCNACSIQIRVFRTNVGMNPRKMQRFKK